MWSGGTYSKGNNSTGGWVGDEGLGIGIEATRHDTQDNDFATGINTCLTKDGQNTPTANLPMGGYIHTGVGNGTARTNYTSIAQFQVGGPIWGGNTGGTANPLTLTLSPAISAYVAGQTFRFLATNANTGASTLQVNSIASPKNILSSVSGGPLIAGNITAGNVYEVIYSGSDFILVNPSLAWVSYTPTVTQGSGVSLTVDYCKYLYGPKTITMQGQLTMTAAGTSGEVITVGLPVASVSSSSYRVIGNGTVIDVSPFETYHLAAIQNTTSTISFQGDANQGNNFGVTPAFALASGDIISFSICYEILY